MLLALALALVQPAVAGTPEDDPAHAYHFEDGTYTAGDIAIELKDPWVRQAEGKVRLVMRNGSSDYFVYHYDGLAWVAGGKAHAASGAGKHKVVGPGDDDGHTFTFESPQMSLHDRDSALKITGFHMLDDQSPVQSAPDMAVPVAKPRFKAGSFVCETKGKVKRKTDLFFTKIDCTYNGQPGTAGLVTSDQVQVLIMDGTAFVNEDGDGPQVVLPGESVTFGVKNTVIQPRPHGVDMQFDPLTIRFGSTFREGKLVPVQAEPHALTFHPGRTAEKN